MRQLFVLGEVADQREDRRRIGFGRRSGRSDWERVMGGLDSSSRKGAGGQGSAIANTRPWTPALLASSRRVDPADQARASVRTLPWATKRIRAAKPVRNCRAGRDPADDTARREHPWDSPGSHGRMPPARPRLRSPRPSRSPPPARRLAVHIFDQRSRPTPGAFCVSFGVRPCSVRHRTKACRPASPAPPPSPLGPPC